MIPWAHSSPYPKRHHNRFSHFCRAHGCAQQTHIHRPCYYICSNRPHLCTMCMRCGLKILQQEDECAATKLALLITDLRCHKLSFRKQITLCTVHCCHISKVRRKLTTTPLFICWRKGRSRVVIKGEGKLSPGFCPVLLGFTGCCTSNCCALSVTVDSVFALISTSTALRATPLAFCRCRRFRFSAERLRRRSCCALSADAGACLWPTACRPESAALCPWRDWLELGTELAAEARFVSDEQWTNWPLRWTLALFSNETPSCFCADARVPGSSWWTSPDMLLSLLTSLITGVWRRPLVDGLDSALPSLGEFNSTSCLFLFDWCGIAGDTLCPPLYLLAVSASTADPCGGSTLLLLVENIAWLFCTRP